MTISTDALVASTAQPAGFVVLHRYHNSKGEVATHTINAHVSYEAALQRSIETLKAMTPSTVVDDCDALAEWVGDLDDRTEAMQIASVAIAEQLASFRKSLAGEQAPRKADAYEPVGPSVKRHPETGDHVVWGLAVRKVVHVEGTYKPVRSRIKTLVKTWLRKQTSAGQFRRFVLKADGSNWDSLAGSGVRLESPAASDAVAAK